MTSSRVRRFAALLALASILSAALAAGSGGIVLAASGAANPAGRHAAGPAGKAPGKAPVKGPAQLLDHGGAVLLQSHTVAIFWGPTNAFDPQLRPAMESLLGGMGGSAYLGIAQQYMRTSAAIGSLFDGSIPDTTNPPKQALSTSDLTAEVAKVVANPDPNTIYFVFTSNLPHINYCAYHDFGSAKGVVVEVAYVPLQPAGCSPLGSVNLQANSYDESVQAAADSAAHEFMEAVTDPHLNAWYDKNGFEIADKCEYDYQGIVHLANRSTWQIQSEWSNATSSCDPGLGGK